MSIFNLEKYLDHHYMISHVDVFQKLMNIQCQGNTVNTKASEQIVFKFYLFHLNSVDLLSHTMYIWKRNLGFSLDKLF